MTRLPWRWILPFLLAGSCICPVGAQSRTDIERGQQALYRLDFPQAEAIFQKLIREQPRNPEGYGMLAIVHWNRLLFAAKNLALDDYATPTPFTSQPTYKNIDAEREIFLKSNARLLELCDRLLEENPEHQLALYFKGVGFENAAAEAIAIGKNLASGRTYGKRAANIHERLLKQNPQFVDAYTSLAVAEFVAASLPWSIRWLAFLIGFRGDRERALQRLETVSEQGTYRQLDAQILLALLQAWKGDPQESVRIFKDLRTRFPENFLLDINLAAIYQLVLEDRLSALQVYQDLAQNLDRKAPGIQAGEVSYRIAKLYIQLGENTRALEFFERALSQPKGEQETAPLSYFHMAKIHEQRGEKVRARELYQKVVDYQGPPSGIQEELATARREVKSR